MADFLNLSVIAFVTMKFSTVSNSYKHPAKYLLTFILYIKWSYGKNLSYVTNNLKVDSAFIQREYLLLLYISQKKNIFYAESIYAWHEGDMDYYYDIKVTHPQDLLTWHIRSWQTHSMHPSIHRKYIYNYFSFTNIHNKRSSVMYDSFCSYKQRKMFLFCATVM